MRLRALQERRQDFPEADTIVFDHEVGRRHSEKFVPGVSEEDAAPWFTYRMRQFFGSKMMTASGSASRVP